MKDAMAGLLSRLASGTREILPDIFLFDLVAVNACAVGTDEGWVMVDAGLSGSDQFIIDKTLERFSRRPAAIILTHGHSDQVGSMQRLAEYWDVPVYAHSLELPYLSGQKSYPEEEAKDEKGTRSKQSPEFSRTTIKFRLTPLPEDGSVPGLKGWRWIHTPGHTEGHIVLFRESDRTLIAGDAFADEPTWPGYGHVEKADGNLPHFSADREKARNSMAYLAGLEPRLVIPSHGRPIYYAEFESEHASLAENFDESENTGEDFSDSDL